MLFVLKKAKKYRNDGPGHCRRVIHTVPEQVRFEEPILVYNFRNAISALDNYYYIISAVHPTYGVMRSAEFSYTPTGGFNCGSFVHTYGKLDQRGSYDLSRSEVRQYVKEQFGTELERDPIAVWLPLEVQRSMGSFLWYFEIPETNDARSMASTSIEYVMSPHVGTEQRNAGGASRSASLGLCQYSRGLSQNDGFGSQARRKISLKA